VACGKIQKENQKKKKAMVVGLKGKTACVVMRRDMVRVGSD